MLARVFLSLFLIQSSWAGPLSQKMPCNNLFGANAEQTPLYIPGQSTMIAIARLQNEGSHNNKGFAHQDDFDCYIAAGSRGGSCATVTAFNAMQSLRRIGDYPNLEPHSQISDWFETHPDLSSGKVSDAQLLELFSKYQSLLPDHALTTNFVNGKTGSTKVAPDLSIAQGEVKILIQKVSENGKFVGRHFVVVKHHQADGTLRVVDPHNPEKDYLYKLVPPKRPHGQWQLDPLVQGSKETLSRNIESILSLQLQANNADAKLSINDLASAKKLVSSTAQKLHSKGQLKSPETWRKVSAKSGLPSLDLPKKYGGQNWNTLQMTELMQHAGEIDLNLRDVVGAAHARPLAKNPNSYQEEILKKVSKGEAYMAISITEPTAGSDVHAMKTTAQKTATGYKINGEKLFNARLENGTHVLLFTKAPGELGKNGKLNAFVIPLDYSGLQKTHLNAPGLQGNSFGGLKFSNLEIPSEFRVGKDGEGGKIFQEHFTYWRTLQSAAAIGTGKGALRQVAERLRERFAFGAPIGRYTHLQQELAKHTANIEMAELLLQKTARLLDEGRLEEAITSSAMLKAEGVEMAQGAADFAMRTFGAEGYSNKTDLSQRVIDLMGLRIADGTTDVLRGEVVRRVWGEDFRDMLTE